ANITIEKEDGELEYFGAENSKNIHNYLLEQEYIDKKGKVQNSLKLDIKEDKFKVPIEYEYVKSEITSKITKIAGTNIVKDANDKIPLKLNKEVFIGEDFKELWDKVKYKTTYRVDFDIEKLINTCAKRIENEATVGKIKYLYTKATNKITKVGVEIDEENLKEQYIDSEIIDYKLPDIITYLQNETKLMRKDIVDILIKSNKLQSFKNNPQKFIDKVIEIIKKTMSIFIVDGIKYQKIGDEFYYAQECFEEKELSGYLSSNLIKNNDEKSVYDYTIYDSDIEKSFAKKFNDSDNVKLFTKLPSWFKINTPLGGYNPDWAVLIEKDNEERLYFVVESKGSDLGLDIKNIEKAKIDCGIEHFKAISEDINFIQSDNFKNLKEHF
ncbi:MAG: type III restriction endonuclease subunit R, partial [Campylobacterota bacterium]|nr:type III restriction endonuclease subunit R [Campylobacterota bacterium]